MLKSILRRLLSDNPITPQTLTVAELKQHRTVQRLLATDGTCMTEELGPTFYSVVLSSASGEITLDVNEDQFNFFVKVARSHA